MTYLEQSLKLIILQYSDKPNATAEMTNLLSEYQEAWTFFENFIPSFDIDQAWGDRLDLIGKIVGFNRTVSLLIDKKYFGFEGQTNSLGFGQAPFYRHGDARYNNSDLNDTDYQFYLKAKIIKNNVSAIMGGENSLQRAYLNLFDNQAYVVDNKDMTLTLFLQDDNFLDKVTILDQLDLMPLPQGVRIKEVIT
jgi:hypothetical protein